jgi:hypothetical protein
MFIPLYRKTFEPPLPNVTAAPIVLMITPHMACQHPLHKLTQCGRVFGFYNEMKVIRHQAKSEELNAMSFLRFS